MLPPSIKRFAWLSIATALATILLKLVAWYVTGSVGLLSDAIESGVNLLAAFMALAMISVASRPADDGHPSGHGKAEYFSSAFEGLLIAIAAVAIVATAIDRLLAPQPLQAVAIGLAVSAVASALNLATARTLHKAARESRSIALEADAQHLMADVWTSAGVIVGVALVALSGWLWLDPVIAIAVALNVLRTGWGLMRRSTAGLMDAALPAEDLRRIWEVFATYREHGLEFHALRTRQAGTRAFISVHVLVPGSWTVQVAHDWSERVERDLRQAIAHATITTHFEPIEDPVSRMDGGLDRGGS